MPCCSSSHGVDMDRGTTVSSCMDQSGWHEIVMEATDARRHNTMREWCRNSIGPEFDDWMHKWTQWKRPGRQGPWPQGGHYTWRFRRREDLVMFNLTWRQP